ncbi:MAG: hypothetical protein HFJ54_04515 [Clostridia bacterium]|nr:hypothetical protein [Clostridia bacterium]
MKALIFYATYGGGHLSSAMAIKEAMEANYKDIEIEIVDCMEYINKIVNKLTTKAYSDMAKKVPRVWGEVYKASRKGTIAKISRTSNRIFAFKLYLLIKKINPDIIISTHPFSTQMCAFLKKHTKLNENIANVLTDFKSHEQWLVKPEYVNSYFVSNETMKKELIEYGIEEEKIFVTGIPISKKFSKTYNKEEILKEFGLKENVKTILFFAGGKLGLAKNNISDFIEIFTKKEFENVQVVAISGKNEKIYNKFKKIVEENGKEDRIKILEYTDKVPELMSISDLVITKPRRNNYI